jgi:hypothetical protein
MDARHLTLLDRPVYDCLALALGGLNIRGAGLGRHVHRAAADYRPGACGCT